VIFSFTPVYARFLEGKQPKRKIRQSIERIYRDAYSSWVAFRPSSRKDLRFTPKNVNIRRAFIFYCKQYRTQSMGHFGWTLKIAEFGTSSGRQTDSIHP